MQAENGLGNAVTAESPCGRDAFLRQMAGYSGLVDAQLEAILTIPDVPERRLFDAMRYSVSAGGKRIRPVLFLAVGDMLGGERRELLPFACALELIHTYSLIHDDLPAMDNDDYRRGRPTSHKVYGEAMAILAGDALLNRAYELLFKAVCDVEGGQAEKRARGVLAARCMADAAGAFGMVGGQVMDMESEGCRIGMDLLDRMHSHKTGALIRAAVTAPAILCGADPELKGMLAGYADKLGVAFQIRDDLLDVQGTGSELGKPVGSDERNGKTTYVTLLGVDGARNALSDMKREALASLSHFGDQACFLRQMAEFVADRTF